MTSILLTAEEIDRRLKESGWLPLEKVRRALQDRYNKAYCDGKMDVALAIKEIMEALI